MDGHAAPSPLVEAMMEEIDGCSPRSGPNNVYEQYLDSVPLADQVWGEGREGLVNYLRTSERHVVMAFNRAHGLVPVSEAEALDHQISLEDEGAKNCIVA